MTDFWTSAWESLEEARSGADLSESTVRGLSTDWSVQRFVFDHKRAPSVSRFPVLRESGVFNHPPQLERLEDGFRATGWPAMTFLNRASRRHRIEIAEILSNLESDNWWVISEGLGLAARLHKSVRREPILHMLDLWQSAPVKWIQPKRAAEALAALAEIDGSGPALEAALTKVSVVLLQERQNSPDLEDVLSKLFEQVGSDHYEALMTGVETALAMPSVRSQSEGRYARDGLRGTSRVSSDALDAMVALWVQMVDARSTREGTSELLLGRAVRLLAAEPGLLRQMGLIALNGALTAKPTSGVVDGVFNEWVTATAAEWLADWRYTADLLDLLRTHQRRLEVESRAALLELALAWASSTEGREQWRAWYLLGALRETLGPREQLLLTNLESSRGRATGRVDPMRSEGGWIREGSAFSATDLERMAPAELVEATTFVPTTQDRDWLSDGATVSGFAQALKAELLRRPDELIPVAADIARQARDASVVYQVAWAVRERYGSPSDDDDTRRGDVVRLVAAMLDRVRTERSSGSNDIGTFESALADLVETLCAWLESVNVEPVLLSSIDELLNSSDPSPDSGLGNDDPPMRALNSVRGAATLAGLRLASARRDRGIDVDDVLSVLGKHLALENDPGVLSAYGRYLGALAVYWPDFFARHREVLLPQDREQGARWLAVFISYVAFNSPHVDVAPHLVEQYSRAVRELEGEEFPKFFSEHVNRLIGHLSGLALPGVMQDPTWRELLGQALKIGPVAGVVQVLRDLAFAIQREGLDVSHAWLLDLAHEQIEAIRRRPPPDAKKIASAWIGLILAAGVRVPSAGGALITLVSLGAKLEEDDLVGYLQSVDRPRSRVGARLLRDAAVGGSFDGYLHDPAALKKLVSQYSRNHRDLAWELVNRLGRAGLFDYERLARSLRPASTLG